MRSAILLCTLMLQLFPVRTVLHEIFSEFLCIRYLEEKKVPRDMRPLCYRDVSGRRPVLSALRYDDECDPCLLR